MGATPKKKPKKPDGRSKRKGRGRGECFSSKRILDARAKAELALQGRIECKTFPVIAAELGYNSAQAARKAVEAALKAHMAPPANELRAIEVNKVDELIRVLREYLDLSKRPRTIDARERWDDRRIKAIGQIDKCEARRAKLLGLNAPVKTEQTLSGPDGGPIKTAVVRYDELSDDELNKIIAAGTD